MPRRLQRVCLLFAVTWIAVAGGASAQVLPVQGCFRDTTFDGTLDVAWPVLFDGCTFRTDSVVLKRSCGALFRNCVIESRSGVLYMAAGGDGMILADCELKGCTAFRFTPHADPYSRNYVSGVTVEGAEYVTPDEDESVIDMDGLPLCDIVNGKAQGPLFIRINADKEMAAPGDTVSLQLMGLDEDEFVGWRSSAPEAKIKAQDAQRCLVSIPDGEKEVAVWAYTEYGLEAACLINVEYPVENVSVESHGWLWRLFHRKSRKKK